MAPHFFCFIHTTHIYTNDSADISPHLTSPVGEGLITLEYQLLWNINCSGLSEFQQLTHKPE